MENQQFQRADFEALIGLGVGKLIDGQELYCGFMRVNADGLYSDYEPEWGEELLFDVNFNREKPVLPFPFTLEQFKDFYAWHSLFQWEVIEKRFTNDDGSMDDEALAELDTRSNLAGWLVRSILGKTDDKYSYSDRLHHALLLRPDEVVSLRLPYLVEQPAKAGPLPIEGGLLTKEIADTFAGINKWSADRWPKNLSASKWLHPACMALGSAGGASSVWNPLTLAQLMHSKAKGSKPKEQLMKSLNSRFNRNPVLMPWRDAFNDYFATHCATD